MTTYPISFPGEAMVVPDEQFDEVVRASHAVIAEATAEGVLVFGGAIDETAAPVRVNADGGVEAGTYPGHTVPLGGYTILDLPSRESALRWAAKLAAACRCAQEVRQFHQDQASTPDRGQLTP